MNSDTSWGSTLRSDSLEYFGDGGGSLNTPITTSGDALWHCARVIGLVIQEVDVNAVAIVLSHNRGDGR